MKALRKVGSRVLLAAGVVVFLLQPSIANAATLTAGSVALGNGTTGGVSSYTFTFSGITLSNIQCIKVRFNTLADGSGSVPTGMDSTTVSPADLGSSTYVPTPGSWSVTSGVNGTVTATDAGGETPGGASARTIIIGGITNPTSADNTFYALVNTYDDPACSASGVDSGLVSFVVTPGRLNTTSEGISDPRPLASGVSYTFTGSGFGTTQTIKCIKFQFTDTATGSTVPAGFSSTGAATSASSTFIAGLNTWTTTATTNGTVTIHDGTGATGSGASAKTVILTGITNGSTQEVAYFVRFNTYTDAACTAGAIDTATVAFIYENGQNVSVDVDPSLTFTVTPRSISDLSDGYPFGACNGLAPTATWSGTNVNLGSVTASSNAIASANLKIWTNATNGFTVYTRYDHTLYNQNAPTPSSVTISDASGSNAAPGAMATGTEGYGYTTDDQSLGTGTVDRFTNGGPNWAKFTTSNSEIAYHGAPSSNATNIGASSGSTVNGMVCVSYRVDISGLTEAGHYTDTVFLTATPVY